MKPNKYDSSFVSFQAYTVCTPVVYGGFRLLVHDPSRNWQYIYIGVLIEMAFVLARNYKLLYVYLISGVHVYGQDV